MLQKLLDCAPWFPSPTNHWCGTGTVTPFHSCSLPAITGPCAPSLHSTASQGIHYSTKILGTSANPHASLPAFAFTITSPTASSIELDDFATPTSESALPALAHSTLDRHAAVGGGGNAARAQAAEMDAAPGLSSSGSLFDSSQASSTTYLARLTAVACLGGLQFGWDTGIASGMLVAIHEDLGHELSEGEQELIVSATTVGAIIGAVIAGRMADWLGRKKVSNHPERARKSLVPLLTPVPQVMIASGVLFLLGSLEQAASQVVRELVLGRVMVGLGVGMASMVVPTYLAEVAPSDLRGRIVGINSLLVTGGQVIAYVIDAAFYNLPKGWRWMVLAGGAPALIQLIGLFYLDESPRWLVARGKVISARHVLMRIYPTATNHEIDAEIERMQDSMHGTTHQESQDSSDDDQQQQRHSDDGERRGFPLPRRAPELLSAASTKGLEAKSKLHMLWNEPANRRALILACGLQLFQQTVGFNSLMYFSGRLLLMAGFANPNAAAVGIAVANFVGTVVAMRFLDSWGRRKLLLWTTAGMAVSLALLSITFGQMELGPTSGSGSGSGAGAASGWAYLALVFMILFTLNYALGLGIVPWLIQAEVFAGPVRGMGAGLATATNWSANLLISATFLHMLKLITPTGCFALYAGVAVCSWVFTHRRLPEMKGVSLSDVQHSFGGGPGAAYQALQTHDDQEP